MLQNYFLSRIMQFDESSLDLLPIVPAKDKKESHASQNADSPENSSSHKFPSINYS